MRKISYVLIAILLSSFVNLLPVRIYSQPNACININGIKTPELIVQFENWLNEPNGLNARLLDGSETSQERGERLFYNLILNNNRICFSDLNQEMINSIINVIQSYENAPNHTYQIDGFTLTRSQMNIALKSIRDPIILGYKSIFAEAVQFGRPISTEWINPNWTYFNGVSSPDCTPINQLNQVINETIRDDSLTLNRTNSITNPIITDECGFHLTPLIDPEDNVNHFLNYTVGKSASAGKQIDFNFTLTQGENGTSIFNRVDIDIPNPFTQIDIVLTAVQADLIIDYSDLFTEIGARNVGGGAGRSAQHSWQQFRIPEGPSPIISNATLWGLFNTSDTLYSILSFDGRDKVFQDMSLRLNLTVTDPQGRNNISQVHALFNSTDADQFLMSFYNDSGTFIFNTTTPLIVENLEGLNTEITDGWNITFIFSLSDQLGHGYIWLSNANATDNTNNSTLVRERWFSFIREPGVSVPGGTGTSELFPLAALLNIFFIAGGFYFILNHKGRIEFQATGIFFFFASLLFILSPIYAVLDSNNVLSYVVLNYPDNIRNNFVLINFVFLGLASVNVVLMNRSKLRV